MSKEYQQFNELDECLLALLRIGLRFETVEQYSVHFSAWEQLIEQARLQTVLPIINDAIMQLPDDQKPPKSIVSYLKLETINSVLSNDHLLAVQDELLAVLKAEDIPCAILKGTSVAVYYPNPELRMQGDIDIMVDKANIDRAVIAMERAGYQNSSHEHGFHKTFLKDNARIELHHACTPVPPNKAGDFITRLMQTAIPMACSINIEKHVFPILTDTHQAVSLLLHMQKHITSSGLGLRQLCDWAVFLRKVHPEQWTKNIQAVLDHCGLLRFAEILTKACVLYLGFPSNICPQGLQDTDDICFALMQDFLKSGNFGRKDTVRGASSILITDYAEEEKRRPKLLIFVKSLNKNAMIHFPILQKIPVLLPVMWVFLPLRYMVRMAIGKRPKHSPGKIMYSAKQRDRLYSTFCLFEADNGLHSSITHEN